MGLPSLSEEAFLDATSTTTVCGQVLYEPTFTWFGWGGGFAGEGFVLGGFEKGILVLYIFPNLFISHNLPVL
jgi:hypothetical protein